MNKKEFLKKMNEYLLAVSDDERKRFVDYYEEMIEDYIENGLSEEDAVKKIGSSQQITKKILGENEEIYFTVFSNHSNYKSVFAVILIPAWGVLLLMFYIILAVVPLTSLSAEFVTAAVAAVSVLGCPFVALRYHISVVIMQLGAGIICCGIFLLLSRLLIVCWANIALLFKKTNRKVMLILRGADSERKF